MLGGYVWLGRLVDIVRASLAGTNGKYQAYDPLSKVWLERIGLSQSHFNAVVEMGADDDHLVMVLNRRCDMARIDKVNRFMLEEHAADLDQLDAEEGYK